MLHYLVEMQSSIKELHGCLKNTELQVLILWDLSIWEFGYIGIAGFRLTILCGVSLSPVNCILFKSLWTQGVSARKSEFLKCRPVQPMDNLIQILAVAIQWWENIQENSQCLKNYNIVRLSLWGVGLNMCVFSGLTTGDFMASRPHMEKTALLLIVASEAH